ncbi:MAG: nucleotidyltransferase domain-containing protein [Bacteroidales bacterium]|nr:nucleotidyltransferase domain-containing protein [Bacteroidales bacterium]
MECEELLIPSIEKKLVDDFCSKNTRGTAYLAELQRSIEVHPVNLNRLHRYASRRGVSDEFSSLLSSLNQSRIELFSATQKYLATIPVVRAWVFGSFARMEERPDSDIDLLVDYDMSFKVSLLDTVGYKLGLEKIIGREVDLIPNGSLKPFAVESANKDKYLIYER